MAVFLNPEACKGKIRNLLKKNAALILQLSGMVGTVFETDHKGQSKKFLEFGEDSGEWNVNCVLKENKNSGRQWREGIPSR